MNNQDKKKPVKNRKPKKIDKYKEKIIVGGSFDELMQAAINPVKSNSSKENKD